MFSKFYLQFHSTNSDKAFMHGIYSFVLKNVNRVVIIQFFM